MAGYQFEKTEIGFNLSFYSHKNLIQLHYPDGNTGIKITKLIIQTVFLIEGFFSEKKLRNCRGRYCLLYITSLQMVRFQKF